MPAWFGNAVGQMDVMSTREPRVTDLFCPQTRHAELLGELRDDVVMVTGAGSAIGREIVRQLCSAGVRELHAVDGTEELLAGVQSIVRSTSKCAVRYSLMDDRVEESVERTMRRIKPTIVIHAGCQLNEAIAVENVNEVVNRNLFAVMSLVSAAEAVGCRRTVVIVGPRKPTAACPLGAVSRIAEQQLLSSLLTLDSSGHRSSARRLIVRVGRLMDSATGVIRLVEEGIQRGDGVRIPSSVLDDESCTAASEAARGVLSTLINVMSSGVYSISEDAMWDRMEVIQTVLEFYGRSVESLPIILGESPVDAQRMRDEYHWSAQQCEFDSNLDEISLPQVESMALQSVIDRLAASRTLGESELAHVLQRSALEFQTSEDSPTVPFTTDRRDLTRGEGRTNRDAVRSPGNDASAREARRDA